MHPSLARRWRRLSQQSLIRHKITRGSIDGFIRQFATSETTLILHPEAGVEYFPNRFIVSKRPKDDADLLVDSQFEGLSALADESYDLIICSGLLEHIADPSRFAAEVRRILRPGGRLVLRCSACFSFHEGEENYFHFTPNGLRRVFHDWERFELLEGSSGPFETIAILLQRISLQSEIFPPFRPLLDLMVLGFPVLDRLVGKQYNTAGRKDRDNLCDSMMPSNLNAVVVK